MDKSFDYEGAREAGYSDEEIEKYLSQPSSFRSKASAFAKGLIKGARSINPMPSFGPIPEKMKEDLIQRFLPSNKGHTEDILETAGELVPAASVGGGSLLRKGVQLGLGTLAKKGLKEIGAPEIVQDLGAATGMGAASLPKAFSKKIIPSESQKKIFDSLKEAGFSDKDITPFIQNPKKVSVLSKFAKRTSSKEELKAGLSKISDRLYGDIESKAARLSPLSGDKLINFMHEFEKQSNKIPRFHREIVQPEIERFMNEPVTFRSIRDFEVFLNNKIKGTEGGRAVLGLLKDPLKKARYNISPELAKKTDIANEVYRNGMNFSEKLGESFWDRLFSWGDMGASISALITMNPLLLSGMGIKISSSRVAKEMLTNPRLQSIRKKMIEEVKKGNKKSALNLYLVAMKELERSPKEE